MAKDKASAQRLDFTNVKEGGMMFNKRHQPAGDYKGKITKVQDAKSKKDDSKMWLFTIEVNGAAYPYYCTFAENQLWKIRNLFVAAGINVPKKQVQVDPTKVVGKSIGVTLEDDEYDGKMQSVVQATFPVSELDGDTDDDDEEGVDDEEEVDEPAPKVKKKKAKPVAEDDDEQEPPAKPKKKKNKAKATDELEELDIDEV